jgi:PAS domain S-box-containing protein
LQRAGPGPAVAGRATPEGRTISEHDPRESEELYRLLVDSAQDYGIMALDEAGLVVTWNPGAQRIFGYAEHEIVGRHFSLFFTPEQIARGIPEQELAEARARGRAEDDRWQVRKDGSRFFASGITMPMQGRVRGYAKVTRDLTERKRAEEQQFALQEQIAVERARLEEVLRQMPAGVLIAEAPSGRLVMGNAFIEKWLRHPFIPAADVSGYSAYKGLHLDGRPYEPHEWPLARTIRTGETIVDEEMYYLRGDGTRAFLLVSSGPVRDPAGNLIAAVTAFNDATDRRAAEQERAELLRREQAARHEAEAAMRLRDEFLATVSHELRTPLTAILLWARILRGGALKDGDRAEALETVERAAEAQSHLIADLLDVSRMMAGTMRLALREVELSAVVESAMEAVRPTADAKGQALRADVDRSVGVVRADPDRLQQVVWNLLSNAVKFTPPGGRIDVATRREGAVVRIVVADNGPGIAADFLPFVFDRFRQAESGTTRLHGGLGLGLTISRQLVEMHGGTLRAESPGTGGGSTFTVELPLAAGTGVVAGAGLVSGLVSSSAGATGAVGPAPAAGLAGDVLQGVRVLVVEDEADTRRVVAWVLEQAGAHVTAVSSAPEAMAALAAAPAGHAPDVLLSDVAMPGEDGYALIRRVRAAEAARRAGAGGVAVAGIPAAALTAYARAEDRARALSAGFQDHVTKPVEPAQLIAVVARLAGRAGKS